MTRSDGTLDNEAADDHAAASRAACSLEGAAGMRLRPLLPLVSIVIVNYNYGRYLGQALASVFAQTYPHVECVLVDNASTDGSAAVIAASEEAYPALAVIRRATNAGQTAACVEGLAASRGPYVIFLDADDYLLADCVAIHMRVHLTTRVHAGFTSADMLQMVDDQTVLSTNEPMATFLRARLRQDDDLLRPTEAALGELWPAFDVSLAKRVHLVAPTQKIWVWAPTSGNCFRRDALALLCDADGLDALASQTDLFLTTGVNAVAGSILIDEPVFVYRLHGSNAFSSRAQLSGVLSYDHGRTAGNNELARRLLIDQFVGRIDRFLPKKAMTLQFLRTLRHLDFHDPGARGSYAAAAVADRFPAIARAGHGWLALLFLIVSGASPRTLWCALLSSRRDAR